MEDMLGQSDTIKRLAERYADHEHCLYLGRGLQYPLALEGALKLKEISYVHAEGCAAGEMKHGPIALLAPGALVVALAPTGPTIDSMASNIQEVKARDAVVLALATRGERTIADLADDVIEVPPRRHGSSRWCWPCRCSSSPITWRRRAAATSISPGTSQKASRWSRNDMRSRVNGMERVLVVGESPLIARLVAEIDARPSLDWRVVGMVENLREGALPEVGPWLGPMRDLGRIIAATCPTRIVLAPAARRRRTAETALLDARLQGIAVEDAADTLERVTGKLPIERLDAAIARPRRRLSSLRFRALGLDADADAAHQCRGRVRRSGPVVATPPAHCPRDQDRFARPGPVPAVARRHGRPAVRVAEVQNDARQRDARVRVGV
jgi:hypothetical protein